MTLERHVQDAHELTLHLKQAFNREQVVLAGHSWGSVLGLELIHRYPEDYAAYVGIGQVVNMAKGESLARAELTRRATEKGDLKVLESVETLGYSEESGWEVGLRGFLSHRQLLYMYRMQDFQPSTMLNAIKGCEDYSQDIQEWLVASMYPLTTLYPSLMAVDFSSWVEYEVPIYFFAGRHDYNTPSSLAQDYFRSIDAPDKGWYLFEESAHSPPWEQPSLFRERLVEISKSRH